MVVHDFDMVRIALMPAKADAPLVVNADAVLAFSVAFERFQPVRRRNPQLIEIGDVIEHAQFTARDVLDIARQAARRRTCPDFLDFLVGKGVNHGATITRFVI